MSGLAYVGAQATDPTHVVNRLVTNAILSAATPNHDSVQTQLDTLSTSTYATKTYTDNQDALFQLPTYYQNQDALNVPVSSVNQPSGVAGLDGSGKLSVGNLPTLGVGYVQGPYGFTASFTGTTASTPLKIADFNIGAVSLNFRPLVFMQVFASALMGHPIIEVRIANSTTALPYASMTTVAIGQGRNLYNDYHAIHVLPAPDTTGQTSSNLGPSYNVWLSAWIYDLNNQSVTVSSGAVASGAAFLLRGAP